MSSHSHDGLNGLENGGTSGGSGQLGAGLGVGGVEAEGGLQLAATDGNGSQEVTGINQQRRRQSIFQDGTTCFTSVDYFRMHPAAYERIEPWLKSQLSMLIGLTTPLPTMAGAYKLILSLLVRYDVRSNEFREMIEMYFSNLQMVRLFQDEMYRFVLSGMRIAVYDVISDYSASRENTSGDGRRFALPALITIGEYDKPDESSAGRLVTAAAIEASSESDLLADGWDGQRATSALLGSSPSKWNEWNEEDDARYDSLMQRACRTMAGIASTQVVTPLSPSICEAFEMEQLGSDEAASAGYRKAKAVAAKFQISVDEDEFIIPE